jgi:ribosomal protein L37E
MSEDDAAVRARIIAENPACVICGWPRVAGQINQAKQPAHLTCQRLGYNPYNRKPPP